MPIISTAQFIRSLNAIVGAEHVLTDAAMVASYLADASGRFIGSTPAVVRAGSVAEVAATLRACAAVGVSVVPQGGNTGLVAGGIPRHGEVVLSLRRLDRIVDVDPVAGQLTAGAGVTIEQVQRAAREMGWEYGVDFGARGSATVGGSLATNAGGNRVVRYGATREQVVGVEAVLADGSVLSHLGGLLKDNTGYALAPLLCGSEGTLAVITAARLRLVPHLPRRVTAMLGLATIEDAVLVASYFRRELPTLESVELCLAAGMQLVSCVIGLAPPTDAPVILLVECADRRDPTDELSAAVEKLIIEGITVIEALVAEDSVRRDELWRWRERHTASIATLGPVHKLDVTLPTHALASFVSEVTDLVGQIEPRASTWIFGHLGDGNVHVNVTGVDAHADHVDDAILRLVARVGGSISAEHGIGTVKKPWLHLCRSEAEIAAMRAIKHSLDPKGLLNPNVLLPSASGAWGD